MNCLKCGANFLGKCCPVCGASAEENEQELQYIAQESARARKSRKVRKVLKIIGIVLMSIQGIAILAGIINGSFAWVVRSFKTGVAAFYIICWLFGYLQLGIVGLILFKIGNRK